MGSDYINNIRNLSKILIYSEDPGMALKATEALFDSFCQITGLDQNGEEFKRNISLENGTAIGPVWAAMCIKDYYRTRIFIKGIINAIEDIQKVNPDQTIRILYAGTGPFASLAIPLILCHPDYKLKFAFLDIFEKSLTMVRTIIDTLNLQDYVEEYIQSDATEHKISSPGMYQMIISETMQHALEKEPQLAISFNLIPQTHPDTIFIPEQIRISSGLMSLKINTDKKLSLLPPETTDTIHNETVFSMDSDEIRTLAKKYAGYKQVVIEKKLIIPKANIQEFSWLVLHTEIKVYKDFKLSENNTGLCAPKLIVKIDNLDKIPSAVNFKYVTDKNPGFQHFFEY